MSILMWSECSIHSWKMLISVIHCLHIYSQHSKTPVTFHSRLRMAQIFMLVLNIFTLIAVGSGHFVADIIVKNPIDSSWVQQEIRKLGFSYCQSLENLRAKIITTSQSALVSRMDNFNWTPLLTSAHQFKQIKVLFKV